MISKQRVKRVLSSTRFNVLKPGDIEFTELNSPSFENIWYFSITEGMPLLYRFFPRAMCVSVRPHDPLVTGAFANAHTRDQAKRVLKRLLLSDFDIFTNKLHNFNKLRKIKSILGPLQFLLRGIKHPRKGPP